MSRNFPREALLLALVVAVGCGGEDPVPSGLTTRLDSIVDVAHKEQTPAEVRDALARQLRVAGRQAAVFPSRETIAAFYARHGNLLVWSESNGLTHAATAVLLDALRRAGEQGLDPGDYATDRL